MRIFAYGSNMSTARLRARVPSARCIAVGRLARHTLRWHKHGRDDSAKCDARWTGCDDDSVWGVLFEIDAVEKALLDVAEGLHQGYEEQLVEVITIRGAMQAWAYFATHINPSLRPFHWYKQLVLAGAREHSLPAGYVERIAAVATVPDPDPLRARTNLALLQGR